MNPSDILPTWITAVVLILVLFIAGVVFVTARDDGGIHRPHWPARYPYAEPQRKAPGPLRRISGALCARLGRGLIGDEEWDAYCRDRGEWEPSEDERTRT